MTTKTTSRTPKHHRSHVAIAAATTTDPELVPVHQLDAAIATKRAALFAAFARDPRFVQWVFEIERGDELYSELATLLVRREMLRNA